MDMSLSGLAGMSSRPQLLSPRLSGPEAPADGSGSQGASKGAGAGYNHPLIAFAHHHGTTARAIVETGLLVLKAASARDGDGDGDAAGGATDTDGDSAPQLTPQTSMAQSVVEGMAQTDPAASGSTSTPTG